MKYMYMYVEHWLLTGVNPVLQKQQNYPIQLTDGPWDLLVKKYIHTQILNHKHR